MEDEKKKKKQKKKKNKQTKTTESESVDVEQPPSSAVNGTEETLQSLVSETTDVHKEGVQKTDVDSDRHRTNGNESASLERRIKELQQELDAHIWKEDDLETNILQLQTEKNSWFQKETDLERKILQLQTEQDSWLQKEGGYEVKINQLVDEAANLNSKGVSLEEQIKQLEREKVSWVQKENSTEETIASLNNANTRLQAQVMELEASCGDLFHQNQQLKGNMSDLLSQIQNLETIVAARLSNGSTTHAPENEVMKSELEAAQALVEKLLSENAELAGQVNDLYDALDRRGITAVHPSSLGSDPMVGSVETAGVAEGSVLGTNLTFGSAETGSIAESSPLGTDPMPATAERPESVRVAGPVFESNERTPSGERMEYSKHDMIKSFKDGGNYMNVEATDVIPHSRDSIESGEIVQIPLDENEVKVTSESEASNGGEKTDVALTDAPLIGAPFRLISFVARYVSGADLVSKSPLNSER